MPDDARSAAPPGGRGPDGVEAHGKGRREAPPQPDAWARAADRAWAMVRRVRLGTRRPANWVQLFKFGVVGASGYAVNLSVFALLFGALDLNHLIAAVGAFLVAVTNNFVWNRSWTFARADQGRVGFQAPRFFTVSTAALGLNLAILAVLVDLAGVGGLGAQAVAVALAMPANFIGNKLWTFDRG